MSGDVHVGFYERRGAKLPPATHLTAEHPVRGIADIAEELDLGRSTTHRYATTLVTLGYLERGPSRKYRLSSRVSDFGLSLLNSIVVRRVAREHLKELRAQTGRTASLGILGGTEVAYIDRWQGSRQGQYTVDTGIGLGTRVPVYCSAAGKALLACLPAAERLDLLPELRLTKRGPRTIVTKIALRAELERIAADGGLAVDDEELLAGRRAIAAVVVNGEGVAIAAVELAVPASAFARDRLLKELGLNVTTTAQRIAAALG